MKDRKTAVRSPCKAPVFNGLEARSSSSVEANVEARHELGLTVCRLVQVADTGGIPSERRQVEVGLAPHQVAETRPSRGLRACWPRQASGGYVQPVPTLSDQRLAEATAHAG